MKKFILLICLTFFIFNNLYSSTINDFFYKLNSDLQAGKYISENELFIVGSNGYLLYSSDNGNSWIRKLTNTEETLTSIGYVQTNHTLFVIGSNGTLLKSTNKGDDWEKIDLNFNSFLYSISFSDNYGIITGDSGAVFTSVDYGETWSIEPKLTENRILRSIIVNNAIYLADDKSTIYSRPINYSEWKVHNFEGNLGVEQISLKFLYNNKKLFLLTPSFLLYKSDNSSDWSVRNLDTTGAINLHVFNKEKLSIIFPTMNNNNYQFFSTLDLDINDPSSTLTPNFPIFEDKYRMSLSFCTSIFANNQDLFAIGTNQTIMKFDNINNEWKLISHQNNQSGYCKAHFFNDSVGLIGKYQKVIEKTTNSGATFLPSANQTPNGNSILNWYFINDNEFYLFCRDSWNSPSKPIYHTSNVGFSLDNLDIKIHFDPFDYSVYNDNILAVCGVKKYGAFPKSVISVYKDYKDNIFYLEEDSCTFVDIKFLSPNSFICSASKIFDSYFDSTKYTFRSIKESQIRMTKDFGQTWKIVNVEKINSVIQNIYFIDSLNGFLFGTYSDIDDNFYNCLMRTTDGGENWETQIDSLIYFLADIQINKNTGLGYLLSGSGFLWQTKDFGANWELIIDEEIDYWNENLYNIVNVDDEFYISCTNNIYRAYPGKFPYNPVSVTEQIKSAPLFYVYPPYPNPTLGEINVQMIWSKQINFENIEFDLYNILGQKIEHFANFGINYELENLATISIKTTQNLSGLYYLKISHGDFTRTFPIIH
ncbi:MAG: hypothetical protein A2X64_09130 [Ignavibacteria bacterium GWF2_33_9]|nr:MAG: hypothetical protein A2X64_09130 [Ignavibacteria bacterium GWF2_33_9]